MKTTRIVRLLSFSSSQAEFTFRRLQILIVGMFVLLLAGQLDSFLFAQHDLLDPRIRWRANVPGRALTNYVANSPNGTVYVNSDQRLMSFDHDGNFLWEVLNTSNREARAINIRSDGALVVGGLGFGQVTALNPDGSLKWAYTSSGNRLLAGPSLGPNGNVYAVANNVGAFSLDPDGILRWIGDSFFSTDINNSPIIFDSERMFVGLAGFSSSLSLHVYDLNDGQEVWSTFGLQIPWNGFPVLDPFGRVIGPRWPTWVEALRPEDGQVEWFSHHPGQVNFLINQPKVDSNGVVYTSDISGADLWAINPDGSTRWFQPHTSNDHISKLSVSPDDTVIFAQGDTSNPNTGTSARWFRGYDTSSGDFLWQIDLPTEDGINPFFPGFDVAFTADSRTAYVTTSYFAAAGNYGYLYAIDIGDAIYGDVNLDGVVDLLDVGPFVDRISTATYQVEADANQDGVVNLLDVGPFIDLLSN